MGTMTRALTENEIADFVKTLQTAPETETMYAAIAALCIGTGARIGEVLELKIKDIVNDKGEALKEITRKVEKKRKTYHVRCAFPVDIFGGIIELHAAKQILRFGSLPNDYAFTRNWRGDRITEKTAWMHQRKLLQLARLPYTGIGYHGLRKTFLTAFFNEVYRSTDDMFLAMKSTQEIAGHENFNTTVKYISGAITPSTKDVQREIWNRILKD